MTRASCTIPVKRTSAEDLPKVEHKKVPGPSSKKGWFGVLPFAEPFWQALWPRQGGPGLGPRTGIADSAPYILCDGTSCVRLFAHIFKHLKFVLFTLCSMSVLLQIRESLAKLGTTAALAAQVA